MSLVGLIAKERQSCNFLVFTNMGIQRSANSSKVQLKFEAEESGAVIACFWNPQILERLSWKGN